MRPNHIIETRYPVSGGDTLTYDCEGNLACVSNAVSGAISLYWYDQHGRRVAKSESGLLTLYIWDGMDIIATAHADGTIREYFTRGIGIAGDVGSLIAETRFSGGTATTTYLHSNWRGDVVMATDASGAVVGEYSYTTFGEQLSAIGNFVPRFTFSSKERDSSGLVYHGFRYYSPVLCRWISEDPIRERGGLNLYQFCYNNPVNDIDPTGLDIYADFGGGGHVGLFIEDPSSSSGWRSYDFSPVSGGWNDLTLNLLFGPSNTSLAEWPLPNPPPGSIRIPTTPQQDSRALCLARQSAKENFPYCAAFNNCAHMSRMILNGSGIPLGNRITDTPSILQRDVNRYLSNSGTVLHIW